MNRPGTTTARKSLEIMALPLNLREILLIVTAMSFDSAALIDQNGTSLCGSDCIPPATFGQYLQDDGQSTSR
jgi:hypothetical protein